MSSVKNEHIAQDIAQETFVRAMVYLADDCNYSLAWLYKVADNLIADYFRQNSKQAELCGNIVADYSVSDQYIRDEQYRQLYRGIASLKDIDRKIVTLFYFAGLSQREIANVTGLSFVNVRVRMDRAREKLKNYLTEE